MKTIFISIYDGDTERVILRTDVFKTLLQSGHRIILLIRGVELVPYYRKEFESEQVQVEALPSANSQAENWWFSVGWNTIPTRATAVRRYRDYFLKKKYGMYFLGGLLSFLGKSRAWRSLLRSMYLVSGKEYAIELFKKYNPDLLFAANMFSPEDARLLATAKKRNVRTVTLAKSWDVLTTKAFTRVIADRIMVYNQFNHDEAIAVGDYLPEQVVITGFPQFDIYTLQETFLSREEFCKKAGLDPMRRTILYGIPGDWKSPDTRAILTELDRRIEADNFAKPIQILARFHPKYPDSSEGLDARHIVFDRPGMRFSENTEFSLDAGNRGSTNKWTFREDDIIHLANSLYHSDISINVDSTLTLDAAALNKPSILIGYDGDRKLSYKESIAFIYEREHYQHVLKTGGVSLVHSHDELASEINKFLSDPMYRKESLAVLKQELLYKVDGKSGERMGQAVLEFVP